MFFSCLKQILKFLGVVFPLFTQNSPKSEVGYCALPIDSEEGLKLELPASRIALQPPGIKNKRENCSQCTQRIIGFLQCRMRPFGPSSLHRKSFSYIQSHPGPILVTPCIYPASQPDTNGQFTMANQLNLHIFGPWEETRAPGGNPRRQHANSHRQ